MRIGILADIHEHVEHLELVLEAVRNENVDELILLGDVAYDGRRIAEVVSLLRPFEPVGVWGNHDLGLAHRPSGEIIRKYGRSVVEFFTAFQPRIVREDHLFVHGLPTWDASDPAAYYLGTPPWEADSLAYEFAHTDHRIVLTGHFHRWFLATPRKTIPWQGRTAISFAPSERYLVIINPVFDGSFAILDTDANVLTPHSVVEDGA